MKKTAVAFLLATVVSAGVATNASAGLASVPQTLAATASNLQVTLTWTAPASNGGETITDYIIEYSSDGGVVYQRFIDAVDTTLSEVVTGLTNGTTYTFRVSAVTNTSGQGPATAGVTGTPISNHTPANLALFSACPTGAIPSGGFTDTSSTDVACIKYYEITKGTTATTYSPIDKVSRWQMALFLTRMVVATGTTLPDGSPQDFADIGGYSSEIQTAINQLKQLGITIGKTATTYAPADFVTREEMALFISRLLKKAVAGPGGNQEFIVGTGGAKEIKSIDTDENFTDVPHFAMTMDSKNAIASLWNLGVTDSQSASTYEPQAYMTRLAMATFMANALDHTNARPTGLILQASTYRVQGTPIVYYSVTHRDAARNPIAGTPIDTFKFTHTVTAGVTRFDTNGYCTISIIISSVSSSKCTVDTADPVTNAEGNIANFWEIMPAVSLVDLWAWTAGLTTMYDNDVHATGASKITVETYN